MLKAGDKVICALSGGADSMALLCALYELKDELGINVYAAHLNHGIRGEEADGDTLFVEDFCKKKGIEIFIKRVDVPRIAKEEKLGEEECGRRERYLFFDTLSEGLGGALIATGHHKNDNAETVLFNLFRGSAGRGMRGIPYKRDGIIRPLLDVKKSEIEAYLTQGNVLWREDSTNKEEGYTRNRIRLVVLKEIEKIFSDAVDKITQAAECIGEDNDYLERLAEESGAFENGSIAVDKFVPLHESLKRRIIVKALRQWEIPDIDREKIRALHEIIEGDTGKGIDLGNGIRIVKSYNTVSIEEKNALPERAVYEVKIGESLEIRAFDGIWRIKTVDKTEKIRDNKTMILLDAEKVEGELTIRHRQEGDYMYPSGMSGKKKLKKIFIDLKIPLYIRDSISLLAEGSEVLFIPEIRKSRKYQPDENTKQILVAEYEGRESICRK